MSAEHPEETRPSFGKRLGKGLLWLLRFALRLFFVVLLGIALGVGVFYGIVALYNQYVYPVQVHTIQLEQLQTRYEQESTLTRRRLNDLHERLDVIALQEDTNKEDLSALEVDVAEVRASQEDQESTLAALQALRADLEVLQADLVAVQADLAAAQVALEAGDESVVADLEAALSAQERIGVALGRLQAEQESIGRELGSQQAEIDDWEERIDAIHQEIATLAGGLEGALSTASLRRDLTLIHVMSLLARARLLLVQSNYGLAQTDLQAARELLVALRGEVVASIVARLDAALTALPEAPVVAADELDGAWQLLAAELQTEAAVLSTLEITPAITATVSLTPTVGPTPTVTVTVTVTPTSSS